jgi:hypothetical protein
LTTKKLWNGNVTVGILKTKTTKERNEFIFYEFARFPEEKWFSTEKKI